MFRTVETERLWLRPLTEADAPALLAYQERNRVFLEAWEAVKPPEFFTRSYQQEMIRKDMELEAQGAQLRLWIFPKQDPGRIVGCFAFSNIVRGAFLSCFLGYRLDGDEINRGVMTEALKEGVRIAFEELGLHRIEANIMPRNVRSRRVVEKLGFVCEGLSEKYLKINGIWEDHQHWVIRNQAMEQDC